MDLKEETVAKAHKRKINQQADLVADRNQQDFRIELMVKEGVAVIKPTIRWCISAVLEMLFNRHVKTKKE